MAPYNYRNAILLVLKDKDKKHLKKQNLNLIL